MPIPLTRRPEALHTFVMYDPMTGNAVLTGGLAEAPHELMDGLADTLLETLGEERAVRMRMVGHLALSMS